MRRSRGPLRWVAVLLILAFLPQGCATMPQSSGEAALLCGAGGALAGGAIGAAVARDALAGMLIGAAIGGLVGAATCFAIAEYKSQQTKGYQETQQAVQYQPAQGNVVQITNFSLDPSAAAQGSQIAFNANYYVMTPKDAEISVTETRTLKKFDPATNQYKEMGKPASSITMKPGTRSADGKFDVRSGVENGKYLLAFKVDANGKTDEKELPFEVTNNQAQLKEAKVARIVEEPVGAKRLGTAPSSQSAPAAAPAAPRPAAQPAVAPQASLASLGEGQPAAPVMPPAAAAAPPRPASAATPAPGGKQRYFVASKVATRGTIREGPGSGFRVIAEMDKNDRFPLFETRTPQGSQTPWHKIRLDDGREGWVNSTLGGEIQE